jgi:hypothetical protein
MLFDDCSNPLSRKEDVMTRSRALLVVAIFCFFAAGAVLAAERMTVIDYYNMNKHDYLKIEKRDGVWKGQGDSGWQPLKVADIANGYVEYEDPGHNNGAGRATYSGALFLTADRQPMLALLQTITSTESKCPDTSYTLEAYRMQGDQMVEAADVVPPLPTGLFLKKGASTEIATTYSVGYRLPRKGTTVEAFLDTSYISCILEKSSKEMKKQDIDAAREFLKNVRTEPVKLKWNKADGKFELQLP